MMAFLYCPGGTNCDDSDGPSAAVEAALTSYATETDAAYAEAEAARAAYAEPDPANRNNRNMGKHSGFCLTMRAHRVYL